MLVLGLLATALFAPAANADIIAATDVFASDFSFDIALVDTATGAHLSLPAGINTSDNELHPSITPDGKRMVFERAQRGSGGAIRIIVVDLATGQQADLFNAFDAGQFQPTSPTITPDGQTVITGAHSTPVGSNFVPTWIETSLVNFPTGPFQHVLRTAPNLQGPHDGRTLNPAFDPSLGLHGVTAIELQRTGTPPPPNALIVDDSSQNQPVSESQAVSSPAISGDDGIVLFERTTDPFTQNLVYRTLNSEGLPNGTTFLLPGVNAGGTEEHHPAFTPGGKYIAYLQQFFTFSNGASQGHDLQLLVYDTGTQTILNPAGIDLGLNGYGGFWAINGGMSLYQTFTLKGTFITFNGQNPLVRFTLKTGSNVGILVQRIVGHHRLFGRRVFKLRKVGRVPFGHFHKGKHRVRWNLKVDGHKLRRGRYLVTPRALTRKGQVRELGTSHVLRIR
jgi:WD40 repeat protein